jgi:hypothetical protein
MSPTVPSIIAVAPPLVIPPAIHDRAIRQIADELVAGGVRVAAYAIAVVFRVRIPPCRIPS